MKTIYNEKRLALAALMLSMSGTALAQSMIENYLVYDVNHEVGATVADADAVVSRVVETVSVDPQLVDATVLNALMSQITSKLDKLESIEKRLSTLESKSCTCCCGGESGENDTQEYPFNGHDYVDLGLPSGLLWATYNIGANSPEEYGDYFAWGETEPKSDYSWSTYKWCNGTSVSQTKYCTDSSYGIVDNKTVLDSDDDAACANWGGNWRMPTEEELHELETKCTWTWTSQSGVNGYKVVGPNENSIFLPAAGWRHNSDLYDVGLRSYYWSSSLLTTYSIYAYSLFCSKSSSRYTSNYFRYEGYSVRPVCAPLE